MKDNLYNPNSASFWLREQAGSFPDIFDTPCELDRDVEVDVCIVGAGYTGMWTAYALKKAAPNLDIVIVEAKYPGYGASGRNGGAVIPRLNGSRNYWANIGGEDGVRALEQALQETVDEVGRVIAEEQIACSYTKAGMLEIARTPLELQRLQQAVELDRQWGHGEDSVILLDKTEAMNRIAAEGVLAAKFTRQSASIHPAALALGLARVLQGLGVTIFHNSPVRSIEPRLVKTDTAFVKARYIVCATEAYTQSIASEQNRIIPVHTSMLVTELLSSKQLESVGWDNREVLLADHPFLHLQRTATGRITIGGDDNRMTYKFGSRPCADGATLTKVHDMYSRELTKLFPSLRGAAIEQSWQGVFGAQRNWAPAVGLDAKTGIAWGGGYVGEGLAASNLAGRTLRDLILGRTSALTRLPWVRSRSRRWELEPMRIIGATAILGLRHWGEHRETTTGKPSRLIPFGNRLAGFTGFLG